MSDQQPDRIRPAVFGTVAALAGGFFWGLAFIYTGKFRSWLAVALGALVGGTLRLSGQPCRGRWMQAGAAALTFIAWWLAFYLAFFGTYLTEVSEQHGHEAADRVPVTLLFTVDFVKHFAGELHELLAPSHAGWLGLGVVVAVWLTRSSPAAR
jgi:hypothetical protein